MKNRKPIAVINTNMREAFLAAPIDGANPKLVQRVAKAATRNRGRIRRFQLWNKSFSKEPRRIITP